MAEVEGIWPGDPLQGADPRWFAVLGRCGPIYPQSCWFRRINRQFFGCKGEDTCGSAILSVKYTRCALFCGNRTTFPRNARSSASSKPLWWRWNLTVDRKSWRHLRCLQGKQAVWALPKPADAFYIPFQVDQRAGRRGAGSRLRLLI